MNRMIAVMIVTAVQVTVLNSCREFLEHPLHKKTGKQPKIFVGMTVGEDLREQVQDGGAEQKSATKGQQPTKNGGRAVDSASDGKPSTQKSGGKQG
jgi:hypothetical protein